MRANARPKRAAMWPVRHWRHFAAGVLALLAVWPAAAQIDLSGDWSSRLHEDHQERVDGPNAVEYYGLPINEDARARALSYSPSMLSILERQCLYYAPYYFLLGPFGGKIWSENSDITGQPLSWNLSAVVDRAQLVIWMDGRPDPGPAALHPNTGFATGKWEGDTLVVHITHMKEGYLRRNGVPTSDEAKATLYFTRHGDTLISLTAIIEDPVYLTEPYVLTRVLKLAPSMDILTAPPTCTPEVELADVDNGAVPHYLPGKNPLVDEVSTMYNIPLDAVLGGAQTMYPEYRKTLKDRYTPPAQCKQYCCGWTAGGPIQSSLIQCKAGP
jgi:hypothetical protein